MGRASVRISQFASSPGSSQQGNRFRSLATGRSRATTPTLPIPYRVFSAPSTEPGLPPQATRFITWANPPRPPCPSWFPSSRGLSGARRPFSDCLLNLGMSLGRSPTFSERERCSATRHMFLSPRGFHSSSSGFDHNTLPQLDEAARHPAVLIGYHLRIDSESLQPAAAAPSRECYVSRPDPRCECYRAFPGQAHKRSGC